MTTCHDFDSLDNGDGIAFLTDNGDIDFVTATNVTASQNGGFGFRIESDGTAGDKPEEVSVTMGDIDTIKVSNSTFDFNGDRAAVGRGSGLMMASETIRTVTVTNIKANNNNDHGVQVTGNRNVSNVTVDGGQFNNNDRNRDTIGDGVQVNANEDMSNITVSNAEASSNYGGIRLGAVGRQIGQNLTVSGNTVNNNVKEGIAFFAGRDLIKGEVTKNTLEGNGTGLDITVIARGSNISVTGNNIKGKDGQGIGILLNATGVTISQNQIRNNATGIEVRKNRENAINNNNIARNESYGVNADALAPGEAIDATNNWWGEPSGPKHGTNPGGIGDRVTDKVNFKPFLDKPAVGTASNFVVESLTADKDDVNTGDTVNFTFVIRNNGDEEGIQDVKFVIKDGLGNVVDSRDMQITVNPQGRREATFSFVFQTPGEYTVTVSADASSKSVKVTVSGRGTCLPFALDNNPKNQKIDDAEIITAIDLWVRGGAVPGCTPPVTISDDQIIQLIDLWVKQSQLTVPLGGKMTSQSATLSVASTFATLGASVRAVRPGESFTVTVNVDAKDGISGLLLSQALPAGWSAKPIQLSGAYFKASETKWLWLNAKGTVSVSYEVTVPATAGPGVYTIAGRVKAAVPGIESELQPLTVEVLGAPVALAVKAITLSQSPVRSSGAYFAVEGVGIAQTTVRVFSLTGKLVSTGPGTNLDGIIAAIAVSPIYACQNPDEIVAKVTSYGIAASVISDAVIPR
jgi:plastocyanin